MFVHHTAIQGTGFRFLNEGEKVSAVAQSAGALGAAMRLRLPPKAPRAPPGMIPARCLVGVASHTPCVRPCAAVLPCPPPQVEFQLVDTERGQQASNVTGPEGAPLDRAAGERAAPGSDEF